MIPVLDLKPLFDGADGIRQIAAQLEQIYSTTGFAQVINHGVPEQIIQGLYQASRNFHQLPEHEKLKLRFRQKVKGALQ